MEIFSALLAICGGGFPSQRPVTQGFDVFSAPEQMVEQTIETR